ncbi:MAG: alpha/beta hydrolase [Ruminococcus sp.]|nr:alpha/beta hydrolase [Ruminococcus sp.]
MVFAIILIVLLLVLLGVLFAIFYKVFYNPYPGADEIEAKPFLKDREMFDEITRQARALGDIPCTRVNTRSYDGLRLSGRYYAVREGAPLCICFHGYRGSALRDFSVMGQFLRNEGYNVIIVDERAHFKSGGHTITYGIRERRDVLSWVEYANKRFGKDIPIYLFGISMGGGTVLMASGLELPDNVRLICADCPLDSPKDIICHVAKWSYQRPELLWPFVRLSALVWGHLNMKNEITAANAVKNAKVPILIIHGEADDFVPAYMSERVYKNNPDLIEYHTFPGAVHGVSYFSDTDRYIAIVRAFIKKNG